MGYATHMNTRDVVRAFVIAHMPVLRSQRVVLAASGGGDSSAMVSMLCEADLLDPSCAVVAHFDHRLRDAAASARDRDVVAALCLRYGLRPEFGEWDAPRSGEAAARVARYAFLLSVARSCGSDAVLTGHTADDQIETVVMRAMRGAGVHGLGGMLADAPWPQAETRTLVSPRVLRPLLRVTRAETRAWCSTYRIAYADDPSNDDRALLRNRVRLDVLPRMLAADPGVANAILNLAASSRATADALDAAAADAMLIVCDGDVVTLPRAVLRALPDELSPYVYRRALTALLGDVRNIDRRHYAALAGAAAARTGATLELPRGVVVTVDADAVVLSLGAPPTLCVDPNAESPLPFVGEMGAWRIDVARGDGSAATGEMLRVPSGAVIRARRPGDRLRPRGMRGHKKLQDYYVDRKIARRHRDAAPVIALGPDVYWTPYGVAEQHPENGELFAVRATLA